MSSATSACLSSCFPRFCRRTMKTWPKLSWRKPAAECRSWLKSKDESPGYRRCRCPKPGACVGRRRRRILPVRRSRRLPDTHRRTAARSGLGQWPLALAYLGRPWQAGVVTKEGFQLGGLCLGQKHTSWMCSMDPRPAVILNSRFHPWSSPACQCSVG